VGSCGRQAGAGAAGAQESVAASDKATVCGFYSVLYDALWITMACVLV
jgi:hypothetical protein